MLPAVCRYNMSKGANTAQQEKVAKILLAESPVLQILEQRQLQPADVTLADILGFVIEELQLPRTLKEVKIGRDQLQELAEHALDDPWMKKNPVSITTTEQVLEILEMVVE
ncbi:hypothetical protein NM208_g16508 [Fusarium decemcellulare]|uniref:Uncharacterized protein n=1 Tax=Fusarium decemcellulare TaxID=57161 RepID=A0ACC1RBQ8_9HYPO|nr:hypothetical protein NM208_g16508 [Fusarium decemcellulare]